MKGSEEHFGMEMVKEIQIYIYRKNIKRLVQTGLENKEDRRVEF